MKNRGNNLINLGLLLLTIPDLALLPNLTLHFEFVLLFGSIPLLD